MRYFDTKRSYFTKLLLYFPSMHMILGPIIVICDLKSGKKSSLKTDLYRDCSEFEAHSIATRQITTAFNFKFA